MLKRIIVASVLDADALFVIAAALFVCGCVVCALGKWIGVIA
jgi:hypothetical protein